MNAAPIQVGILMDFDPLPKSIVILERSEGSASVLAVARSLPHPPKNSAIPTEAADCLIVRCVVEGPPYSAFVVVCFPQQAPAIKPGAAVIASLPHAMTAAKLLGAQP
jgi:hypothetical protein